MQLKHKNINLNTDRAQVHFELCKCEEQIDQIAKARDEAAKALKMDYGTIVYEAAATNVCTSALFWYFFILSTVLVRDLFFYSYFLYKDL